MRSLCAGDEFTRRSATVSAWSVGSQLSHIAKVDSQVLGDIFVALDGGEPRGRTRRSMTWTGRALVSVGWLPRGVGKAPASVVPEPDTAAASVLAMLDEVERYLDRAEREADEVGSIRIRIRHPYFGGLTPAEWLRFIPVHHHHHLKIVRDILAIAD